jgi:predicted XRE-type DNA-binding protein
MTVIKKQHRDLVWEEGSENVFADLGMHDADERFAKARLALKINEIIAQKNLKQKEAAKLLGIDQPKISLLHRGRLADFSIERLAHFLTLLNQNVDIVIRGTNKMSQHGRLRVVCA